MKDGQTIGQQINWDFETNGNLEIKDKVGLLIYLESSDVFWAKWERDSKGRVMYYEDSTGYITDNRPKTCENKEIVIEGIKYKLVKQ